MVDISKVDGGVSTNGTSPNFIKFLSDPDLLGWQTSYSRFTTCKKKVNTSNLMNHQISNIPEYPHMIDSCSPP